MGLRKSSRRLGAKSVMVAAFFSLIVSVALPQSACSGQMDPDTRMIARDGFWGLVGGTAAGLVILPLGGSVRTVFIGSSIGLYMGIVAGIYFTFNKDPILRAEGVTENGIKDTSSFAWAVAGGRAGRSPFDQPPPARAEFSVSVFRF